ncbi:hypothetical protein [Agrococcus sp. ARC_14]|uniref:hypothetical protein n=1 Tax=Agrococcus sp. ARC_14 TaxID=2919927 RepID=UPI001F05A15C|nr:hypothetical protein [Agrococcus sp. ARC_14]MCH1881885.1 hypothetical protein [Agrococcus sp. ARC_14]
MNDEQMSDEFKSRMRQGLSSMAVRERMRERSRNRAIAGGALAAVVVATVAVFGAQALGGVAERDQAAPSSPTPTVVETPTPGETTAPTPAPTESPEPEPTAPPGLEGVAAGEPLVVGVETCADGCGDAGAAGPEPIVERIFDIYLVCEGRGTVFFGSEAWIDCSAQQVGSGFVQLDQRDVVGDGDLEFTSSEDFNGALTLVDAGQPPVGTIEGDSATVWVTCSDQSSTITVGGVAFDCSAAEAPADDFFRSATLAAWGVPILPGEIAPRIERDQGTGSVSFVVER